MIFASQQQTKNHGNLFINSNQLEFVEKFKYLGVWIKSNLSCCEHIKQKKMAAMAAAYKLNSLGINSVVVSPEIKGFLINVYCRSALQYGIENSFLNEGEYKEIASMEGRIIKRALALTKYHSTSMIINSLDIEPLTETIKMRKASFVKQLMGNRVTRKILNMQLGNLKLLANKSLIREIVKITKTNIYDLHMGNIGKICQHYINKTKNEIATAKATKEAVAVRYLLEHRNMQNDELLRKLTHWSSKSVTRKQTRTPTRTINRYKEG